MMTKPQLSKTLQFTRLNGSIVCRLMHNLFKFCYGCGWTVLSIL